TIRNVRWRWYSGSLSSETGFASTAGKDVSRRIPATDVKRQDVSVSKPRVESICVSHGERNAREFDSEVLLIDCQIKLSEPVHLLVQRKRLKVIAWTFCNKGFGKRIRAQVDSSGAPVSEGKARCGCKGDGGGLTRQRNGHCTKISSLHACKIAHSKFRHEVCLCT